MHLYVFGILLRVCSFFLFFPSFIQFHYTKAQGKQGNVAHLKACKTEQQQQQNEYKHYVYIK